MVELLELIKRYRDSVLVYEVNQSTAHQVTRIGNSLIVGDEIADYANLLDTARNYSEYSCQYMQGKFRLFYRG